MQDHGDKVRVVGLGTQDNFELAQTFQELTGTEQVEMYWDSGFDSWNHYQIRSQPQAILLAPDGTPLLGWRGAFDVDKVLELAADYG